MTWGQKKVKLIAAAGVLLLAASLISLRVGKYPLAFADLLAAEPQAVRVFLTLRLPRTCTAVLGGFALGVSGMIYQTVFRNPLASPDIIGVSSGASAGAAFAILYLAAEPFFIITGAFFGSFLAVLFALLLSMLAGQKNSMSIVLSGLAVHALAQTVLMVLKLTADPEKELASIEYWMMGSLNGITMEKLPGMIIVCVCCIAALFLLYRQVLLLSVDEDEAALLGAAVGKLRFWVLMLATLAVAAVVSVTGIISFVGLIAPHCARLLFKDCRIPTLVFSGLSGGVLLCIADILARSAAAAELPVSIFTSLIGAPFLLFLLFKRKEYE